MSLVDPADSLERQNHKLLQIAQALMRRVELGPEQTGAAYAQFERNALLEQRVRERTLELERTLNLLHDSNAQLSVANAQIETARGNLAGAIEAVSEGFALFDADDYLVMANARFCQQFVDVRKALLPGLPFTEYVQMISQSGHLMLPKGDRPQDWAARRIRRHLDHHVMFKVQVRPDRWLQVSEHRTRGGGTVILQTDVTDLIRIERAERERLRDRQTAMVRATLDHLNQGVGIFDSSGQLLGWNEKLADLMAVDARRLRLGASFTGLMQFLAPEVTFANGTDRAGFLNWATTHNREPVSFEIRRGPHMILQVFGQGIPDEGFVVSVTDVTAERDAARRLSELNEALEQRVVERTLELEDALSAAERANASKSRFVAAASHDLLQPLSAAKLYLSSLSDQPRDPGERAVLEKAESALTSAAQMIDALLDISRLDGEGLHFDIRPVRLDDVLQPLAAEMSVMAERKGLDLRLVSSDHVVESDPAYLRRIVQNLLANAIRYTEHGKVLVGVRHTGNSLRVEVHDTGPGIAEEDQNAIFEEFRRLDTRASRNEGLGLGLAIVERACARLGHPLGVQSTPGRGSCFMVTLPLADQPSQSEPRRITAPVQISQSGLIVLLVENDANLRRALTIMLESWDVHVLEACNAAEAHALLMDLQLVPDALLADYKLGDGSDGLALMAELTGDSAIPLPAAIITADRSHDLQRRCKQAGATLLAKPLDRHKLAQFLQEAARQMPRP
ncbi:PAS-domain containing protein [Sagittula sp. SSi028]|uniref:hybrid sensor histidine kinase/response regulator n=1 Tax=Sagittula sp. SSi028 TaxID=3400636 RepID=UPI003AF676F3